MAEPTRTWKCPRCGADVPAAFLLCDCGYQAKTHGESERGRETPARAAREQSGRPTDDRSTPQPPRRVWLDRLRSLLVVLAAIEAIVAAVWIVKILFVVESPSTASALEGPSADDRMLSTFIQVVLIGVGALVSLIGLLGSAEAIDRSRDIEGHLLALRADGGRRSPQA